MAHTTLIPFRVEIRFRPDVDHSVMYVSAVNINYDEHGVHIQRTEEDNRDGLFVPYLAFTYLECTPMKETAE